MKIGLTQRILYFNGSAYDATQHGWYSYLKGHTIVPIPNRLDQDFEQLAVELDALIIPGGDDSALRQSVGDWKLDCVDLFKQGKIREARTLMCQQSTPGEADEIFRWITVELKLAGQMALRKKPIVGVCHGCFLLVDVLGGEVVGTNNHNNVEHLIKYFGDTIIVNSFHNLSIKQLHQSATVLATDIDGNIEAWIDGSMAGIVWHPERMKEPWIPDEIKTLLFKD